MTSHSGARLAVIGGLASFGPLSLDLNLPSLPRIGAALHASAGVTQLSVSGCLVGLAVGQFIFGPLGDRFGRRRPLLAGVGLWTVAALLCAIAPDAALLVTLRVIMGIGGAAGLVLSRAVVRDIYADRRALARAFAVVALMTNIAPAVAPVAGGGLLALMSWRGLFWVLGGVGVLLLGGVILFLGETLPDDQRRAAGLRDVAGVMRGLLADRAFRAPAAAFLLASAMLFTYISLSSLVLQRHEGLSAAGFSLVFAANSAGMIASGAVTVRLLGSRAPAQLLRVGLLMAGAGTVLLLVLAACDAPTWALLIALFCAASTIGITFPTATTLALVNSSDAAGAGSAVLGGSQYLAGGIAGPVVALFGGTPTVMAAGMAVFAVAACGGGMGGRRE